MTTPSTIAVGTISMGSPIEKIKKSLKSETGFYFFPGSELWDTLVHQYGDIDENGVKKVVFPDELVEAFREGSFYTETKTADAPTITERIAKAEIIEGLPFESLEHVAFYKRKMGREKDLNDLFLIEQWLRTSKRT